MLMLIRLFFIFLFTILYAKNDEWFITNLEYGKMLYNNPRGISCAKCHGTKEKVKQLLHLQTQKVKKKL